MKFSKQNIALFIAILFHVCGAVGIIFSPYKNWFIQNTTLNLLIMVVMLIYTQPQKNSAFYIFAVAAFATGMLTEMIGINTGYLFGNYQYSNVMGYKLLGVPLLIGVQWFVTVFCCGIAIHKLHVWTEAKYAAKGMILSKKIQAISFVVDAALLTTLFDFIMEPVAMELYFWQWQNNVVPFFNYACWFLISSILLMLFRLLPMQKHNHFAIHLLIIQTLFFLVLRSYL
ncbi:MAG: carotenoid biosynthesis protein [Chitinophagaceae bacterium]|jgi:putative membrane protein|nr:carotenoid biosynthesis protein [Chitinophagaceae bacterium]